MIELWLGALGLFALAALFLLRPALFLRARWRGAAHAHPQPGSGFDAADAQSDPYPDLGSGYGSDPHPDSDPSPGSHPHPAATAAHAGNTRIGLWLLLSLALFSLLLYQRLGAAPDLRLTSSLQNFPADASAEDYLALMRRIERRAAQRPNNLRYQALLGRHYMSQGDYERAGRLYRQLAEAAPEDASAAALAARAIYLAAGQQLTTDSQLLAERALSINPHQPTALGLLGMAAYEGGQYMAAVNYWERLLAVEPPDSPQAQMIRGVIDKARSLAQGGSPADEGGVDGGDGTGTAGDASGADGAGGMDSVP